MTRTTPIKTLSRIAGASMIAAMMMFSHSSLRAEEGHEGHDHGSEKPAAKDNHAEHDHEAEGHADHVDEVKISAEAIKTFGITVEKATRRVLTETVLAPARVAYNGEAMAHVGSPVAGRAGKLRVRLGDVVKKGDVLAIIESPDLGGAESELLQKRSLREAAESAVEVAKLAFQRAEELRKTNSVSVTDLLSRQGDLKKAEGELKVAEAAYLAAENRLHILGISQDQVVRLLASGEVTSRFELKAPIAGTVVQREVTPGEIVGPDREALMILADMTTLWVLADVPERVAHRVMPGSTGRISLGGTNGAVLEGAVVYIAPELNPRTRTAQVRLVIDATGAGSSRDAVSSTSSTDHDDHAGHDHDAHESEAEAPGADDHADHDHEAHETEAAATGSDDHSGHDHQDGDESEHTEPAKLSSLTEAQIAEYKAKGDWCAEHGTRESTCTLCSRGLTTPSKAPSPMQVGQLLRPGLFAQVELELRSTAGAEAEPVLAVPEDAVQTVEGREAVFIPADEPNTFTPALLTLGRRVGHYYPVLSGLKEGDSYVAKGSFLLKAELGKEGAEHEH